ncbi:MAG: hypothetical protein EBU01_11305 [Crocinitomicaceae bacterium]|nr:hypothetical protein [Crocinitomicaceae bacterium]NCA21604.1 hypothetical protein [Crocinitomicaceae bacterium]
MRKVKNLNNEKSIATALKLLAIFTLLVNYSLAQNSQPQKVVNVLKVEIIDIVERNHLTDLQLIIWHKKDTVNIHIDSVYNLFFELNFPGKYYAKVIKEGYDTLIMDWENPALPSELILEFYMPKKVLSRKEKRIAHKYSVNLPERNSYENGGFEKTRFVFNELCVIRYRYFNLEGMRSGTTWDFRKFKEY